MHYPYYSEGVFNHHTRARARFQAFDEVLQKKKGSFAGMDRKVLLNLLALFSAERRVGENHVVAILLLNIRNIFSDSVLVWMMFGVSMPCKIIFMIAITYASDFFSLPQKVLS